MSSTIECLPTTFAFHIVTRISLQKLCPAARLDDARKLLLHMMSFDTLLRNYGSLNLHFVARTTAAAWRLDACLCGLVIAQPN